GALLYNRIEFHLAAIAIGAALAISPRDEYEIVAVIDAKLFRVAAIAAQKQDSDRLGSSGLCGESHRQRQLLSIHPAGIVACGIDHPIGIMAALLASIRHRDRQNHDQDEQRSTRDTPPDQSRSRIPDKGSSGHRNSPNRTRRFRRSPSLVLPHHG